MERIDNCMKARLAQVALYSGDADEAALMDYLEAARDVLGAPLYNPEAALRFARQAGHLRACVALLCQLELFEARRLAPLSSCFPVAAT